VPFLIKNPKKQTHNDLIGRVERKKERSKAHEYKEIIENEIGKQVKVAPEMDTEKKNVKIKKK
jgi:hypothetical protein